MIETTSSLASIRGPVDHSVRDQIVAAATEHFTHYGYKKTTVSDIAKKIGFSKAYIYKFFDSKQAIGEVITTQCLDAIVAEITAAMADASSATERLRRMFHTIVRAGMDLFFHERELYDVAAFSASENWPPAQRYLEQIRAMIKEIVLQGRAEGEFERKTPLDETVNAIFLVIFPYLNPLLLKYNLDTAEEAHLHLSNLILRSLAP